MTESKAELKYREFESLRSRFGEDEKREAVKEPQKQRFRRESAGKRRPYSANGHDSRANAPPLVPLVEEGDQQDQVGKMVENCSSSLVGGEGAGLSLRS